jgi:hypothetical protein
MPVGLRDAEGEERKQFFFEKKNQKTFAYWCARRGSLNALNAMRTKVFCFFFSKKNRFL